MAARAWDKISEGVKSRIYDWGTVDLTADHESPLVMIPDVFMAWLYVDRLASMGGGGGSHGLAAKFQGRNDSSNEISMFGLYRSGSWTDLYQYAEGRSIAGLNWRGGGSTSATVAMPCPSFSGGGIRLTHVADGAGSGSAVIKLQISAA